MWFKKPSATAECTDFCGHALCRMLCASTLLRTARPTLWMCNSGRVSTKRQRQKDIKISGPVSVFLVGVILLIQVLRFFCWVVWLQETHTCFGAIQHPNTDSSPTVVPQHFCRSIFGRDSHDDSKPWWNEPQTLMARKRIRISWNFRRVWFPKKNKLDLRMVYTLSGLFLSCGRAVLEIAWKRMAWSDEFLGESAKFAEQFWCMLSVVEETEPPLKRLIDDADSQRWYMFLPLKDVVLVWNVFVFWRFLALQSPYVVMILWQVHFSDIYCNFIAGLWT